MYKNIYYIQPRIKVVKLDNMRIMSGSSMTVTENGEADAKAAGSLFIEEDEEDYIENKWR